MHRYCTFFPLLTWICAPMSISSISWLACSPSPMTPSLWWRWWFQCTEDVDEAELRDRLTGARWTLMMGLWFCIKKCFNSILALLFYRSRPPLSQSMTWLTFMVKKICQFYIFYVFSIQHLEMEKEKVEKIYIRTQFHTCQTH